MYAIRSYYEGASHLAYIKSGSGAGINDIAGIIPISSSILEHHISKFKAGGSSVSAEDEDECRNAKYIRITSYNVCYTKLLRAFCKRRWRHTPGNGELSREDE